MHHPKGESITRRQANERQPDSLAMWKRKWGLQGLAITVYQPENSSLFSKNNNKK